MIHVCGLAHLHQVVADSGARHVVSMLKDVDRVTRPASVQPDNHLVLSMDDIAEPLEGYVPPAEEHVTRLIGFVRNWDRSYPLVVHCFAGIIRSTAGAFVTACTVNPARSEVAIARELRRLSPTAFPNPRIVAIADRLLGRSGRMVEAIAEIGAGQMAYEASPFRLALD
jgi:predicted protein tyrosine phosphatase